VTATSGVDGARMNFATGPEAAGWSILGDAARMVADLVPWGWRLVAPIPRRHKPWVA